jgi:hypothetical protein
LRVFVIERGTRQLDRAHMGQDGQLPAQWPEAYSGREVGSRCGRDV